MGEVEQALRRTLERALHHLTTKHHRKYVIVFWKTFSRRFVMADFTEVKINKYQIFYLWASF